MLVFLTLNKLRKNIKIKIYLMFIKKSEYINKEIRIEVNEN